MSKQWDFIMKRLVDERNYLLEQLQEERERRIRHEADIVKRMAQAEPATEREVQRRLKELP